MLIPSSVLKKQKKPPKASGERAIPTVAATTHADQAQETAPATARGSRFTEPKITSEYLQTLVCALELIFSDYAYHEPQSAGWIEKHERRVDDVGGYYHLASLITHPLLTSQKPPPTQPLLHRAITEHASPLFSTALLEKSKMIQRVGLPPPAPPPERTLIGRTVYVEAHLSTLTGKPAQVAYYLKHHSLLSAKYFPVQHISNDIDRKGKPRLNYAWVILNAGAELQWREGAEKWKSYWPNNWIVLTKREHKVRTAEYCRLREENAASKHLDEKSKRSAAGAQHRGLTTRERPEQSSLVKQETNGRPVANSANDANSAGQAQLARESSTAAANKDESVPPADVTSMSTGKKRRRQLAKKKMKAKKKLRKQHDRDVAGDMEIAPEDADTSSKDDAQEEDT